MAVCSHGHRSEIKKEGNLGGAEGKVKEAMWGKKIRRKGGTGPLLENLRRAGRVKVGKKKRKAREREEGWYGTVPSGRWRGGGQIGKGRIEKKGWAESLPRHFEMLQA